MVDLIPKVKVADEAVDEGATVDPSGTPVKAPSFRGFLLSDSGTFSVEQNNPPATGAPL